MILAVWSGPRNLSTALMYAFAQRAGCEPVDEPFYAAWLASGHGADHPMREAIMASQPTDAEEVARAISAPTEGAQQASGLRYLKLMCQHMTADMPLGWCGAARHVHLIRHPARVAASFAAKKDLLTHDELGFARQEELFERVARMGLDPVVVEAEAIRADPEGTLTRLCEAVGLEFDPAMLSWPRGPKAFDGVWAPHWYGSVHGSTGFAGPEGEPPEVPHAALMGHALPIWERMRARAV